MTIRCSRPSWTRGHLSRASSVTVTFRCPVPDQRQKSKFHSCLSSSGTSPRRMPGHGQATPKRGCRVSWPSTGGTSQQPSLSRKASCSSGTRSCCSSAVRSPAGRSPVSGSLDSSVEFEVGDSAARADRLVADSAGKGASTSDGGPSREPGVGARSSSRRIAAVSYTHLRAHETDSYLVCRLLLEKKK